MGIKISKLLRTVYSYFESILASVVIYNVYIAQHNVSAYNDCKDDPQYSKDIMVMGLQSMHQTNFHETKQ